MLTAGLLSSSPPRRAIGGGRRIPEFKLSEDYPYVPRASFFEPRGESYLHLLKRLRECASDASVRGVLIRLDGMPFSLAQVEEIRRVIKTIRASGRPVVVYLDEDVGNAGYYLATAADRVLAHPAMTLDLIGLSAEMLYYRGILDTLGVGMQYAARSEYKSAIEPLTRNGPSPASIEQLNALLDDLHGGLVDAIAEGRGRTREEAQALLDEGPWTAREALEKGLIEGVAYPDEFDELLAGTFPKHFTLDDRYRVRDGTTGWANPRRIAVVTVAGAIVSGPSEGPGLFGGEETAGSETVVKALEQAARDDTVKAVVLRVDSPGGSAFASDQIWRGVEMVQRAQKPVVVSMGGYAASGGYYVSAGADAILALPSTVTGSIGVFGGKVNFEGLFDKAGIESWEILRGRKAGMWSMARPMDPTEMDALDHLIGETYSQFKGKVAEGRGLDADRVEGLARGRVWSGRRAIENGLVDQEGGFFEAVDLAREKAGLSARTRYDLITYAAVPNAMDELPSEFLRAALRIDKAPASLGVLSRLRRLEEERLWMMLPYEMEIR
jgi:protease-4